MTDSNFPALYEAADIASLETQNLYLKINVINNFLLIFGAAIAILRNTSQLAAGFAAFLFLVSLMLVNLQKKWYQARALAESIKTATWKLVMGAEPYSSNIQEENLQTFRALLVELLSQNKDIGKELSGEVASKNQVTEWMTLTINKNFEEKRELYRVDRIEEQRSWYAKKSGFNRIQSKKWFIWLVVIYLLVIALVLLNVAMPKIHYLPIDVLVITASSIIGWVQIKRFDELSSAYGLTAHEIGVIRDRYTAVRDSSALSDFVNDAENAFSREHTQWAARRDH
jgi:hypothetical protein